MPPSLPTSLRPRLGTPSVSWLFKLFSEAPVSRRKVPQG